MGHDLNTGSQLPAMRGGSAQAGVPSAEALAFLYNHSDITGVSTLSSGLQVISTLSVIAAPSSLQPFHIKSHIKQIGD